MLDIKMFDSPSFIQKIIRKKSYKYNIRPLYTADMVSHDSSRIHESKTKKYNHPTVSQSNINPSSLIASNISDSSTVMPTSSISTPQPRKRPLSSEILIKIMDQRILKKQQRQHQKQLQQQQQKHLAPPDKLRRSTSETKNHVAHSGKLNKLLVKPSMSLVTSRRNSSLTKMARATSIPTALSTQEAEPNKKQKTTTGKGLLKKSHLTLRQQESIAEWPNVLTLDNDEQDRMVAQHYLLRTAFGSDFKSPVKALLKKGAVVLDVGCGTGTWTMEMSTAFPRSTFIGIDQASCFPKDIKPRNCHFRTCGPLVLQQFPLPFPDNSIDFIYQRDLNWGLAGQTWQPLLQEYQRILKPGGWIECVEPDLETQSSLENECAMNDKLISGLSIRQQDPYAVHRLPTMLSLNGFCHVESVSESFPLGWGLAHSASSSVISKSDDEEEEEEVEVGKNEENKKPCSEFARAVASQHLFLLKSLKPWLSQVMNQSHDGYDAYISGLPEEWSRARSFINWHCVIAQKPHYI
ncbi:S-adenosyl-L-methionine-dependent methyltransferase [Backusella circina FSU 941]|nr:S-adenosyl-L-methionine-dependent methyltransferase [Backusella circina FSU 941]